MRTLPRLRPVVLAMSHATAGGDWEERVCWTQGGFDSCRTRMRLHIGTYNSQTAPLPFIVDTEKHCAIWGKSGVGKSTLLKTICVQHIRGGGGLTVIDPHGDLVEDLLDFIPVERTNDVILLDPKSERPIGLNIFEGKDKLLSLDALITFIKTRWPDGWGPRTDQLITNAALAILDVYPRPTIIHVHKFFSNKENRRGVFDRARDPVVRDFIAMFDGWEKRLREEASAAPGNKVSKFLTNPLLRDVFGQARSLSFRDVLAKKRILLCTIPKGSLGSDVSSMVGSTVIFKLFQSALEREDVSYDKRVPHLLVIDEVKNFADGAMLSQIFAEARKYRLTLFIAGQMPSQLDEPHEVFGNVATNIAFRLGGRDAKILEEESGGEIPAGAFVRLPNRQFYGTTIRNDTVIGPVRGEMLPMVTKNGKENRRRDVINWSFNNYGVERAQVERKIADLLAEESWRSRPRPTNKRSGCTPNSKPPGERQSPSSSASATSSTT